MAPQPDPRHRARMRLAVAGCLAMLLVMTGLAASAVPLYHAFCAATGLNGARRGEGGPLGPPLARTVSVHFDTNVKNLPWTFTPEQDSQTIHVGAPAQAFFKVTNHGSRAITGRAAYNIAPAAAAEYFIKTQCFCFSDQTIPPGKTMEFPVLYYVESKYASDPSTAGIDEIVLSYTFYPAPDVKAAKPA